MVLFLGTNATLDTTEFSPESPAFYVGALSASETPIRDHFSTPFVYHLGAHTSCGCGYGFGQDPEWYAWAAQFPNEANPDPDPLEPVSRRQLANCLRQLVDAGHRAEVYACWNGDEAAAADYHSTVPPEAFLDPASVRERHHLVVTDAA